MSTKGKGAFSIELTSGLLYNHRRLDHGPQRGSAHAVSQKKWDWLLILHILIILWAVLFVFSLFYSTDGGRMAGMLAPGNFAGLFISIPLAIISLIARAKKRFSENCSIPIVVLSIVNICVGVADWIFFVMIMRMP